MERFTGLLGVLVMIGLGYALSYKRSQVRWQLVGAGVLVQIVLAALVLRMHGFKMTIFGKERYIPGPSDVFHYLGEFINKVIQMSQAGIEFVFGAKLADPSQPWGFIFAVKVLPIIIFFSALMSILYYAGLMQRIVAGLAWCLRTTLRVTGAEATCMAANIFIGQTEAPLTIKPLIPRLTQAQLMLVMLGGFAHIAGSVLGAYVMMLGGDDKVEQARYATHLIGASLMSAPAAFVMARIIMPETESPPPEDARSIATIAEEDHANIFDAAAGGATTGMRLAINIAAMLIAFVSLLALINWPLHALGETEALRPWLEAHGAKNGLSLQVIFGWILAPLAWTMGVPWQDAFTMGSLLGEKLILTEFVAYLDLGAAKHAGTITPRTAQIGAYALCGFANFASIAIQIGGLSVLAPERRKDFARLALRAMLGGALATQMTASIAGLFIA
jgi:CNT family concentrative nucleoside transporter